MVTPNLLTKPELLLWSGAKHFRFRHDPCFQTFGEPILVTDPIYLADVYNSEDPLACYVREQGVIVNDFGGDTSCPVLWQPPYLMLILDDTEVYDPFSLPPDAKLLADVVGCDSGSFVFLPLVKEMPSELQVAVTYVLARNNGAALPVPSGKWSVWYEDWKGYHGMPRKIVARCQYDDTTYPVQFALPL